MNHIGIDLGGTKIEGILLDGDRTISRVRIPTPRTYDGILDAIEDMVARLGGCSGCTVGLGSPGAPDPQGRIRGSNIRCIRNRTLRDDISSRLQTPVRVGNDADCFALAESRMGAGVGRRMVFGVILGTGVGGGIVMDGTLWSGSGGMSGEWGHSTLHPGGAACWCGKRGCVEAYLSGPALQRAWTDIAGTRLDMPDIVRMQPPGYDMWRRRLLDDLAVALSGPIQILDPDAVVLGGGLSNIPFLYDEGAAAVHKMTPGRTPILRNVMGDSSGVIGAALIGAT